MIIPNIQHKQKLNKHQRAKLDEAYQKHGMTYLDCLRVISKILNRTILSYKDIYAIEFDACLNGFNTEFSFTWENGVRKVCI